MSESGVEYTRTEVVKSQPVIDAYVRLMDHGMGLSNFRLGIPYCIRGRREGCAEPVCRSGPAD